MNSNHGYSRRKLRFRPFKDADMSLQAAWALGREHLVMGSRMRFYQDFVRGYGGFKSRVDAEHWVLNLAGGPVAYFSVVQLRLPKRVQVADKELYYRQLSLVLSPSLRRRKGCLARIWSAVSLFVFQEYGLEPIEVSADASDDVEREALERIGYRLVNTEESETVRMMVFRCKWEDLRGVL